jgi:hypothetical protein
VTLSPALRLVGLLLALVSSALSSGCASEAPNPAPQAWTGVLHPPGPPGGSITNTKQCECRACDPESCCSAEKTESAGATAPECKNDSYTFSEGCGITIQTCTPRCYSHVWRVGRRESCSTSRPLVCCE